MQQIKVKFSLNITGHIEDENPKNLEISTEFKYKNRYIIRLSFDLDDEIKNYTHNNIKFFYKPIKKINFEICNYDSVSSFELISSSNNKFELYKLILKVINYILGHIRNNGFTPYLSKIPLQEDKYLYYLNNWNTKIFTEKNKWKELVEFKTDFFVESLVNRVIFKPITVKARRWPYVEVALRYNLPILFQYELIVNTFEFTWQKNFRIAYIECVNALEVVLSEYTNLYYINSNLFEGLNKSEIDRIKSYITGPDFNLYTKIITLLFLTCDSELKFVSLKELFRAINIRNNIVHAKGNKIPDDENENEKIIFNVLILIFLLTNKIQQLSLTTELLEISKAINEKNKDIKLVIFKRGKNYFSEILYFFPDKLDKNGFLKKLLDYINYRFKISNPDFKIDSNFELVFKGLFNEVNITLKNGNWKFY